MVSARASILIPKTPEQVFRFIAVDFVDNYRRWSPEVQRLEILTPGPFGVGSRARQIRVDRGRRSDTVFRVVAFEEPRRVGFVESADRFVIDYHVEPAGEGTRLTFVFKLRRLELYMRPFEKLIRLAVQDGVEQTVRNIRGLLSTGTEADAGKVTAAPRDGSGVPG